MTKHIDGYTYVRCQIPPDVAAIYEEVARRLDWNKPAIHMAALCLLAYEQGAAVIEAKIRMLLLRLDEDGHRREFSEAAGAADEEDMCRG